MYELADGRGWVHDYDPEAQDEIGAVACSLVRTTLSPGSLGTIFSEPDLNKGGGHAVVSFRPGSPLKAAGILPNDALVMVDQVPVSGHTQVRLMVWEESNSARMHEYLSVRGRKRWLKCSRRARTATRRWYSFVGWVCVIRPPSLPSVAPLQRFYAGRRVRY